MPPEGADFVLSSDVPHGEGNVLVLDGLDVETCVESELSTRICMIEREKLTDRRDRRHNLTQLQLVQNSGFTYRATRSIILLASDNGFSRTSSIETNHQDACNARWSWLMGVE